MRNPLELLLPDDGEPTPHGLVWGTVEGHHVSTGSPLVRLDGSSDIIPGEISSLIAGSQVIIGDRVLVAREGAKLYILGRNQGINVPNHSTEQQVQAGINNQSFITPLLLSTVVPPAQAEEVVLTHRWKGQRVRKKLFDGVITQAANVRNALVLDATNTYLKIISVEGYIHTGVYPMLAGSYDAQSWSSVLINAASRLELVSHSPNARTNAPYEIAISYVRNPV